MVIIKETAVKVPVFFKEIPKQPYQLELYGSGVKIT